MIGNAPAEPVTPTPSSTPLAVVTGGASGIGAAVAAALAADGADVVVADIDQHRAAVTADRFGGRSVTTDVTDREQVVTLFADLDRPPSVLVTSAGGAERAGLLDIDEATFSAAFDLNFGGFWRCAQEACRRAVAAGTGLAIVHIASSLHRGPAPGLAHFAAAKAASVTLVRCFAQELAGHGIRVNAVVPGPVETPMTAAAWDGQPGLRQAIADGLPLGRIGRPDDIAAAVRWLVSDAASWVTGTILTVDGGHDVRA